MIYSVGDIIKTKKNHACGSAEWEIMRTGADYKIKCTGCGRIIMLDYEDFVKKVKKIIKKADNEQSE